MAQPQYKLSQGIRKYIREEKARIRRTVLDIKEQAKQIDDLYKRFERMDKGPAVKTTMPAMKETVAAKK